jgi:hypothetical protein
MVKPGRLKILYTESCNKPARAMLDRFVYRARSMTFSAALPFEQLLRYHRGYLDINGASPNQLGWTDEGVGGWFTYVSKDVLAAESTWDAAIARIKRQTSDFYKKRRKGFLELVQHRRADWYRDLESQLDMSPVVFQIELSRDRNVEKRPLGRFELPWTELVPAKE